MPTKETKPEVRRLFTDYLERQGHRKTAERFAILDEVYLSNEHFDVDSLFEKSYAYKQHDHLICEDCEHVFEFCDPRIQQIQSMMGELLKFNITHHSLNLYGKCKELETKGTCKHHKK